MKEFISTWIYLDSESEKSIYPNNKGNSASQGFQEVYWKCVYVFFCTSLRFHIDKNHILFTNTNHIPTINGIDFKKFFDDNNIEVVVLENKYPLPDNFYESFRNQFFEFSIINYLSNRLNELDIFLLLDSDCVFAKPLNECFCHLNNINNTALTYVFDHKENQVINGVSGREMKTLFNDYGLDLKGFPKYSGGEVLMAKGSFFKNVANDFPDIYTNLIQRFKTNTIKFNEEAHVLSYFYYKYDAELGALNSYIKRMWTNQNYYRNVEPSDLELAIWHLPNEKKAGIDLLYKAFVENSKHLQLEQKSYVDFLENHLLLKSNHKRNIIAAVKNRVYKLKQKIKEFNKN